MAKPSLLLVDADLRSLRVLEVSLKKAGFLVTIAVSGADALAKVDSAHPALVISDTHMPEMDGFELCRRLKASPQWADVPFIFLTSQTAVEDKIRGLELGVEDYLTKPIYLKEILTRVRILLQKRERAQLQEKRESKTKFAGVLSDMAVVDLIQTIEISRKSGVIHFTSPEYTAAVFFRNGKVIDAEHGRLVGADAVYRLLIWADGNFEVEFKNVRRKESIALSSQGLLMEGMRRVDEWGRLLEQLPPLDTVLEVVPGQLAERIGDVPDESNGLLRLVDGRRTIMQLVDDWGVGDLEALTIIARMFFEGLIAPTERQAAPVGGDDKERALVGWLEGVSSEEDGVPTRGGVLARPPAGSVPVRRSGEITAVDAPFGEPEAPDDLHTESPIHAGRGLAPGAPTQSLRAESAPVIAPADGDRVTPDTDDAAVARSSEGGDDSDAHAPLGKPLGIVEEGVDLPVDGAPIEAEAPQALGLPSGEMAAQPPPPEFEGRAVTAPAVPTVAEDDGPTEPQTVPPGVADDDSAPTNVIDERGGAAVAARPAAATDTDGDDAEVSISRDPDSSPTAGPSEPTLRVPSEPMAAGGTERASPPPVARGGEVLARVRLERRATPLPIAATTPAAAADKAPAGKAASTGVVHDASQSDFTSDPTPLPPPREFEFDDTGSRRISSDGAARKEVSGMLSVGQPSLRAKSEPTSASVVTILPGTTQLARRPSTARPAEPRPSGALDAEQPATGGRWMLWGGVLAVLAGAAFLIAATRAASRRNDPAVDPGAQPAPVLVADAAPAQVAVPTPTPTPAGAPDAAPAAPALPDAAPAAPALPDAAPATPEPEQDPRALIRQARRKRAAGQRREAMAIVEQALAINPASSDGRLLKAELLLDAGERAEALAIVGEVLDSRPKNADAWRLKGMIHLASGDKPRARTALERSLELRPDGDGAQAVRALLKTL